MTAIFAYVTPDIVFVAGDSRRDYIGFEAVRARKVHFWTDRVLFAQCGDGKFLSALVEDVKKCQPMVAWQYPDLSDDEQLLKALAARRTDHYNAAVQAHSKLPSGAALISGAILVAGIADLNGPERITAFDFATGGRAALGTLAADGTDPTAFLDIAQHALDARAGAGTPVHLDEWAVDSIEAAMAAHPKAIGWPADMIIARPDPSGRTTTMREVNGSDALRANPVFAV